MKTTIKLANTTNTNEIVKLIKSGSKEKVFRPFKKLTENSYLEFTKSLNGYTALLALINRKIIGYIDYYIGIGGVGILLGIYITPKLRKKRIGTKLLNTAISNLKKLNIHKIRTEVYSYNKKIMRFCNKNGFIQEGYLSNDEFGRDVIIYSKIIGDKIDNKN